MEQSTVFSGVASKELKSDCVLMKPLEVNPQGHELGPHVATYFADRIILYKYSYCKG